jgi:hypothetical protein
METNIDGICHVTSTRFAKIDHGQDRFLRELGISVEHVFEKDNFAPPKFRRNIGMLGLLHKRVLGSCHSSFECLLPWNNSRFEPARGHNKTLYGHTC